MRPGISKTAGLAVLMILFTCSLLIANKTRPGKTTSVNTQNTPSPTVDKNQPLTFSDSIPYTPTDERVWQYKAEKQALNVIDEFSRFMPEIKAYTTYPAQNTIYPMILSETGIDLSETIRTGPYVADIYGHGDSMYENMDYLYFRTEEHVEWKNGKEDTGQRKVSLGMKIKRGNEIFSGETTIPFKVFTPNYCSIYSTEQLNSDLFLVCAGEKVEREKVNYLVLGFQFNKKELVPIFNGVFEQDIPEGSGQYTHWHYRGLNELIKKDSKNFYLVLNQKIVHLTVDENGYLKEKQILEISTETDNSSMAISNHSPDNRYFVLDDGKSGLVFDTRTAKLIPFSASCQMVTPEDFYNRSIEPVTTHPYKSLHIQSWQGNQARLEQTVLNAGCVREEGLIDLTIGETTVDCKIQITGKWLGC